MEDNRSGSLIFLDESVCRLVSKYSLSFDGRTEMSIKDAISSCEKSHKTMDRGCYTVVIHKTQATYTYKSITMIRLFLRNMISFDGLISPTNRRVVRDFFATLYNLISYNYQN